MLRGKRTRRSVDHLSEISGGLTLRQAQDDYSTSPLLRRLVASVTCLKSGERDKKIACTVYDAYYICNNAVEVIGVIDNSLTFIIDIFLAPGCEE